MSGISAPPVPIKLDANGNVLANINAQNITPNAVATNVKTDANGNVLANINAQNINPTVANSYTPQLLSHQTGLSASISSSGTWTNLGSSITVPRDGVVKIILIGHMTGGSSAQWRFTLTRGSTTYTVQDEGGHITYNSGSQTSPSFVSLYRYTNYGTISLTLELPVLASDVLQLQGTVTTNVSGVTVYADDLIVILQ